MTTKTDEQERADFEAWYRFNHGSRDMYERDASGEYADKQVQGAFNVWQARAALKSQGRPVAITDDDILAIAGRVESCPVSPWWLKDDVAVSDVRAAVLRFASALLAAALQTQDREDSAKLDFIEKEWFYRDSEGCWAFNFNESWDAGSHESLREAIDSARRIEGGGR